MSLLTIPTSSEELRPTPCRLFGYTEHFFSAVDGQEAPWNILNLPFRFF